MDEQQVLDEMTVDGMRSLREQLEGFEAIGEAFSDVSPDELRAMIEAIERYEADRADEIAQLEAMLTR